MSEMSNLDVEAVLRNKPTDQKTKSTMIFNGNDRILYKKNKRTGRPEITSIERPKK